MSEPRPKWRTGKTVGITLYRHDVCVGSVVTAEIAEEIVTEANELARVKAQFEAMTDQAGHNAGRVLRLEASHPKCLCCGKLASCLGSYESDDAWGYACDECCGHGNEDGQCFPLDEIPTRFQGALKWVDDANERADRAEAHRSEPDDGAG